MTLTSHRPPLYATSLTASRDPFYRVLHSTTSSILHVFSHSLPFSSPNMMLTASPFYHQSLYTPIRPSPLSERTANVVPIPFTFSMASPLQNDKKPVPQQREYKKNPVMQNRDATSQRRRDMFFRRVQKDREDRKWEARGEQVCATFHARE